MSVHSATISYPYDTKYALCDNLKQFTFGLSLLVSHGICHWKDQK